MKSGAAGEIVQVKGGHILRSTGRKDRHSKVYTAKGPRDRRVRLAAHTAIQFYDVQDRLGYDRPSKAVDWLIGKAKSAIDKLSEVPANGTNVGPNTDSNPTSSTMAPTGDKSGDVNIVTTMKSFFPTSGLNSFPGFTNEHLGLSLHSDTGNSVNLFQECYPRIDGWGCGGGDNRVGFVMASPAIEEQELFSQGLPFSNRALLQSNLGNQSWQQTPLSASMDHQNLQPRGCQPSDFGTPLEFGYTNLSRNYGEEEPESHV